MPHAYHIWSVCMCMFCVENLWSNLPHNIINVWLIHKSKSTLTYSFDSFYHQHTHISFRTFTDWVTKIIKSQLNNNIARKWNTYVCLIRFNRSSFFSSLFEICFHFLFSCCDETHMYNHIKRQTRKQRHHTFKNRLN